MAPLAHRKPGILILVGAVALAGAGLASTSPSSSFAPWSALDAAETLLASAPGEGTGSMARQQANVELARQLLQASNQEPENLRRAVLLAQVGTMGQARALGLPWADPPRVETHASPSEAVLALLAAHDAQPSAPQRSDIAALDALPEPARGALARFVDAFLSLEAAAGVAYGGLPSGPVRLAAELGGSGPSLEALPGAGELWRAQPDGLGAVLAARSAFLEASLDARDAFEGLSLALDHQVPPVLRLPPVLYLDLSGEASVLYEDFLLVLDVGGNDAYYNNAGGNNLGWGYCISPILGPAAALVDLAGNDQYGLGRSCGANGGGFAGVGFLVDAAGNDAYRAGGGGVNGGGFAGLGSLVDAGGIDLYQAGPNGANGGGVAGVFPPGAILAGAGMLVDVGGPDVYTAQGGGVNGGGAFGAGFLFDGEGADRYTAGDFGANGGGFFGGGLLVDGVGDDVYTAGGTATNGGARAGAGSLVDGLGDDTYTAGFAGVNGGVSFAGVGLLLDGLGADEWRETVRFCSNRLGEPDCSWVGKGGLVGVLWDGIVCEGCELL